MSDTRSLVVAQIIDAVPNAYTALVVTGGTPSRAEQLLGGVRPEQLINGPVRSQTLTNAMLAGLWLWHDALDESHRISQGIETPDGSYWHAIMHRREGDFSNSKYWLARCRGHSAGEAIARQIASVVAGRSDDRAVAKLSMAGWDPFAFVDLAEAVHDRRPGDPLHAIAVDIQRLEWRTLFDYCAARA